MDWPALLRDERLPAAIVDLDAFDRNLATVLGRMSDPHKTLRVASKSIRVPALIRRALAAPRVRGVMAYSAHEAAWLAAQGFDDLLVAYPIARASDAAAIAIAARSSRVLQVVDDTAQLDVLAASPVPVCIDVDVSWRPAPGLHLGVRRSPIRTPEAAVALARAARERGLPVGGVMAYEAQVAGLSDAGAWFERPAKRLLKHKSRPLAAARRRDVVDALRAAGFAVPLVNGGGTGSVASTSEDAACTEVTAGSGFLCPHLFDGYEGLPLVPAAFFALPIVRRSDADHVTAYGGGIVASGSIGPDRHPRVHWPPGLAPLGLEGWGEVQTPFRVAGAPPAIGSPVVCRPAKAGEWLERFTEVLLVKNGAIVERAPTYRGLGGCFG